MTAYAGIPRKREMSPIPLSLTRSGYPRPSFHRRMMYVKDEKANQKSTSEDFSLSKVIQLAKKVNKSTFESIITPVSDMDRVLALTSRIKLRMVDLFNTYPPFSGHDSP